MVLNTGLALPAISQVYTYENVITLKIVYPKDVDCNGNSDQRQQNQGQHSSVGVHHTGIFRASSATAEEGDDKHESTDDDQNDRCVEVGVAQKVQILKR